MDQTNLRKRIAGAYYSEDGDIQDYGAATHYSYDIEGNVKILWQDIPELESIDATSGLKRLDYDYDIISGKVNRLSYQQGKGDQFFYQYIYDADNRVIGTSTSRDGLLWHQDASYSYYLHGPLARIELGTDKVQGIDYVYTLQGWLKGINSSFLGADKDMAGDGLSTTIYAPYARDVYGLTLGYYSGDYSPIATTGAPAFSLSYTAPSTLQTTGNGLYNGNISQSTLGLSHINGALPVGYSYGYDQLNRLVGMRQHSIISGQGSWSNNNIIDDYKEDVAYDANGNILQYLRNGTTAGSNPLGMDSLTYVYNANTNQLNAIHDSVPAANYENDLDNQSANNYAYDSIGNMIQDNSLGTSDIKWTVYGKIKQGSGLGYTEYFRYDPNNNRIAKEMQYNGQDNILYYIRDAQGNVLATYNYDGSNLSWVEQDLYGSNRLGIWNWKQALPSRTMLPQSETDTLSDWYMLGTRSYELTNHLENVLGVISDKKIGVSSGGSVVDYYKTEVLSENDYYPFGMEEPVRGYNAGSYAYGFNGKRMEPLDPYITDLYDYGNRMYYGKVGRFFTVDPLTEKYPNLTPYQFASNTPIQAIDLDGLEKVTTTFSYSISSSNSKSVVTDADIQINNNLPRQEKFRINFNNKEYNANSYHTLLGRDIKNNFNGNFTGVTTINNSDLSNILAYSSFVINYLYNGNVEEAVLQESNAGPYKNKTSLLDFKHILFNIMSIPQNNLINIDGTVYNPNEVGNYLWGMTLEYFGSFLDPKELAQAGSLIQGRFDEEHEQRAIQMGQAKAYQIKLNRNSEKIFKEYIDEYLDFIHSKHKQIYKPSDYLGLLKEFANEKDNKK